MLCLGILPFLLKVFGICVPSLCRHANSCHQHKTHKIFPFLIQNCNQVRSSGESQGAASQFVMFCGWQQNVRAACQEVKPGSLEGETGKLTGTNCQNIHVTATHRRTAEAG